MLRPYSVIGVNYCINNMNTSIDTKRIVLFLLFAFGLAWFFSLLMFITGGIGTPFSLIFYILIMTSPAAAHLLTRLITREGWKGLFLQPKFKRSWRYYLIAWVGPPLLTIAGLVVFFVLFPQYYDPALGQVQKLLKSSAEQAGQAGSAVSAMNPWIIILIQVAQAILIAPPLNGIFTLGEEFGWRAYLQPKLMPLGGRRAMLAIGIIWGVWHWPVIMMGHNYGLGYSGAPLLGMLAMVVFTIACGTFLGWATLRAGSVWPAVIGHGAINGIAALGILFAQGEPNPILGPAAAGVIGAVGFIVAALLIFYYPRALRPAEE